MNRKEKVFAYIRSEEYVPLKLSEIVTVLDVPEEDANQLFEILSELCDEGKIYITKKGRYVSVADEALVAVGHLVCNAKGYFGFLICEQENEEDIFIQGDDMGNAFNGDRVLVRIEQESGQNNRRQGRVVKVLERRNKTVVGVIDKEKDGCFRVVADNKRIYAKIIIDHENAMTAKVGDRVAVELVKYTQNQKVFGEVISVLGRQETLKSCVEGIIIGNNIKQEFDKETINEAEKVPQQVTKEQIKGREDLRDLLIFTIDGDDARDFDDAVSLSILENGNYYLGVHIADVSEYVTDGSALENEAYVRGTSVYLADRVIPMLPTKLSNGICSLNPDVERLTLSIFIEMTGDGSVVNHKLCKSVIRSKERMTYNNVNAILEDENEELTQRYNYMIPTLKLMEGLAESLRNKRTQRGAIQFDFSESYIVVDEQGEPIDIAPVVRGVSNKMIEEFMLIANEVVAEYAFWSEIPFIYRNHEAPSLEKIMAFNEFILHFGLSIKGKVDKDTAIHPKAFQQIIDEVIDTPEERIVSTTMLHSMMKAKYSEENLGHFGLAAKYYCHFTSPIRRYPDLAIHRILKKFIDGKLTEDKISYLSGYVAAAGKHSSDCEVNAETTERDVDDLMKTAYMQGFLGESLNGTVANVTNFGMFVELENSIEGLIRLENMTDDYYEFDEKTNTLVGKRKNKTYTTGDEVKIVVARTDITLRQIDFVLEKDVNKKLMEKFEDTTKTPKSNNHKSNNHKKKRDNNKNFSKKYNKKKK